MPIWSEILAELVATQCQGHSPDFDGVRRKYLAQLHQYSERNIILYASGWLQSGRPLGKSGSDLQLAL